MPNAVNVSWQLSNARHKPYLSPSGVGPNDMLEYKGLARPK